MGEPFKNMINEKVIREVAGHLARVAPEFDQASFVAFCMKGLEKLELKERTLRLTDGLERFLPDDFPQAVEILVASLAPDEGTPISKMENGIRGWPILSLTEYVARHGQHDLPRSMNALREMTIRCTAEMSIRPFIQNHRNKVLKTLMRWTKDENQHVRRLVSEGTRPRLPWAMQLKEFIDDPAPILPLLEKLKDDPEEYVRRSVANNLNDIAKDHPDLVVEIAARWLQDATPERSKLVRHALRTLVKAGHPGALKALGYSKAKIEMTRFQINTPTVEFGSDLEFDVEIVSKGKTEQSLVVDYIVHHVRANGKTTPKVFKWKNVTLKAGEIMKSSRSHPIRPITTRRYYSGLHRVEIVVNGKNLGGGDFELKLN